MKLRIDYDSIEKIDGKLEPGYSYYDKLDKLKYLLIQKSTLASIGCVVYSTEKKPIVGTMALDTCHGILFYNRSKKVAIVGHETPGSTSATRKILSAISKSSDENQVWEYLIISGFRNVERKDNKKENIIRNIILLFKKPNIRLIPFTDISTNAIKLDEQTLSYEFAFDAESGKFVTNILFFDITEFDPRYKSSKRTFK